MKLEIRYFSRRILSSRFSDGKEVYQKSMQYVQNCCFARLNRFLFIHFPVVVAVVGSYKFPNNLGTPAGVFGNVHSS